jgi:hypothetical protein
MAHPVCKYLGGQIKSHILSKNISTAEFSRQVSVDYMVIYRLISGNQKGLSFFDAKKILQFLEPSSYIEVLADFFPNEVKELSKSVSAEQKMEDLISLVEFTFADIDRYRVYVFVTETPGVKREDVEKEFGRIGAELLGILLDKGSVVATGDGTFKGLLSKVSYWPEFMIKSVTSYNTQLLSLSNPGTHLRNWYVGLSEHGLNRYYEVHQKFLDEVTELANDESLKGNILVGSTVMMGPLNSKQVEAGGQQ